MRSRIERAVTSDATGLNILGLIAIVRGVSYFRVDVNRIPAHWLEGQLSPTVWAWVWILIGVGCFAAAVVPRILPITVGLAVGLNSLWALSFLIIWATGDSSRAYVSALGYLATAGLATWGFGRGRDPQVVVTIDPRREAG
ncbi:hypothetical protein [uncultured Corynebacterium sp.]|uniref:hypothetical protein n=1 Tax=uncultured Corynebacterium sp. TaxID=159447 RepID=UPI0025E40F60|nr:hypothetical protein [uncultured Corynebacterium sp.]